MCSAQRHRNKISGHGNEANLQIGIGLAKTGNPSRSGVLSFLEFAKSVRPDQSGFNSALDTLNTFHGARFQSTVLAQVEEFMRMEGGQKLIESATNGMPLKAVLELMPEATAPKQLAGIIATSLRDKQTSVDAATVARVQQIMESLDESQQKNLTIAMAKRCASTYPQSVAAFWDKFDQKTQAAYAETIFDSLAKSAPAEAAKIYATLTDPAAKLKAYPRIQAAAAKHDGPGTLANVLQEPDPALRSTAAGMAYAVWAAQHTVEALQHLEANADAYDLKALQAGAIRCGSIDSPGSSSSTSEGHDTNSLMPVLSRLQKARQPTN